MVSVTLSVPEELKKDMDSFVDVNWSAVARKAFEEKVDQIEFLKAMAKKSRLTIKMPKQ